jgi:hypothetical protein
MGEEVSEMCAGSGSWAAEPVILDTVPGVEPQGTCPVCGRNMPLRRYRLPDHEGSGVGR